MKFLLGISVFVLGTGSAIAGTIPLEKMTKWSIVIAQDAISSERFAAEEFQTLFQKMTGISLPIVDKQPGKSHNIVIGPGAATTAGKLRFDASTLGEEALRIRISRDTIVIAGGRPRGTLYGVYEFFERYCGARFLTCDQVYFPDAAHRAPLEETDFTYNPPFSFRWSYYKENSDRQDFAARLRVNTVVKEERLGGSTRQTLIGHSYAKWITPEKYGKTHPEYFALVDGERKCNVPAGATEPCVTNPEVIDIIADNVLAEIAANSTMENIAVSQNDNDAYCHCPQCEAINQREGTPMGANLALVNAVAERVEKKHPNVKIGTLAYWYTRKAPKTIAPRKNVQIQLCSIECCELHSIDDPACAKNQEFCADMRAWKAISDNVWVWNYNTNFSYYDLPFPNLQVIGPNIRFFQANNAKGVFMQANGNGNAGEMCDLRNYVMARCLWDPALDSWALTEEFCELHYQEAAPIILEYLKLIRDNAEAKHAHPNCGAAPIELGLTPEIARKAVDSFVKARAAAKNDTVRARVEKASIPAYRALILVNGYPWKVENGTCRRDLPEEYKNLVSTYIALCKKYNMSMVSEQLPSSDYFERLQKMEAMPVSRIENSVWRLTVLPEQNGKLIEMFHKPTGKYLLPAITRDNVLQGALDEVGQKGFASTAFTPFRAETTSDSIHLTRTLDDSSTVERRITLSKAHPDRIEFESRVTHRGATPAAYQFRARPEFDAFTASTDPDLLGVYVKGATWQRINRDWNGNNGPDKAAMLAAKGGGIAYFNRDAKAGVRISYSVDSVKYPQLWWRPQYEQVNLELFSMERELKTGESLGLAYRFQFLSEPPK
ncbi:MAG: DUF4838 domain-containing protein [Candidatus Hydrogenedentes bacterium]|nr:DUF4838 domain-containing protein [Candidatus Hydrogenedentota bacterium]